jgi:hypothetical protein
VAGLATVAIPNTLRFDLVLPPKYSVLCLRYSKRPCHMNKAISRSPWLAESHIFKFKTRSLETTYSPLLSYIEYEVMF